MMCMSLSRRERAAARCTAVSSRVTGLHCFGQEFPDSKSSRSKARVAMIGGFCQARHRGALPAAAIRACGGRT